MTGGAHAAPPTTTPPAPLPSCPPAGSPAGAVGYYGTHSGGGSVCLTVLSNFAAISSFHVIGAPGNICEFGVTLDRLSPNVPIASRAFSTATDAIQGLVPHRPRRAGHLPARAQHRGRPLYEPRAELDGDDLGDATMGRPRGGATDRRRPTGPPPVLRLRGAAVQHPLRRNRVVVTALCRTEACVRRRP